MLVPLRLIKGLSDSDYLGHLGHYLQVTLWVYWLHTTCDDLLLAITCSALQWACWQYFAEPFGLHLSMLSIQQHWKVLCEHPSCGNGIGSLDE